MQTMYAQISGQLVPLTVSDEQFASIITSQQSQPTSQPPEQRVVTQTIDNIYLDKSNQLKVVYHMTFGRHDEQWEYWVPKQDEDFIANSGLEVGKSYDITMEKTFSKNGKPRYRWTHIEPR